MASGPFHICHLSDLHITPKDSRARSEPKLFGALTGMNQTFRRLLRSRIVRGSDLLLITGDITDRGDLESWQNFWEALTAAGLADRTLALPGNHDVCHLGAPRVGPTQQLREEDLDKARRGLRLGPDQHTAFPWVKVVVPKQLAIIGIDSTNAANASVASNAIGHIGFGQLEAFARLLKKPEVAGCALKVVALHHSPNLPERRAGAEKYSAIKRWGHEVPDFDRKAFRLLCLAGGVTLVAHGHMHTADKRRINGVRMIGAPASTQPIEDGSDSVQVWRYTARGAPLKLYTRLHEIALPDAAT